LTSKKPHSSVAGMSQTGYVENRDGKIRVRFGRKIQKRCKSEAEADRLLTALRYMEDERILDPRDYSKGAPLSIRKQAAKWLALKTNLSGKYRRNLERWMEELAESIQDKNTKHVTTGDIEDFMGTKAHLSEKTRCDMLRCYDQFFRWFARREKCESPEVPLILNPTLGWREITDLETQAAILEEVRRIAPHPKIWVGIKWLATYIAIRPKEMRVLRERDINLGGKIICRPETTKEHKPKLIAMLDEDIDLYASFERSPFPDMKFFRWDNDKPFYEHCFYYWWVRARNNLGLSKVGLYGGTRSTGATALTDMYNRQQIKEQATMHGTDKAFDRYCQRESAPSREIYQTLANARKAASKEGKVVRMSSSPSGNSSQD
jgi:hypothetical protein